MACLTPSDKEAMRLEEATVSTAWFHVHTASGGLMTTQTVSRAGK